MATYQAPLRDVRFCVEELLDYPGHYARLGGAAAELSAMEVAAICEEVARFAQHALAPLNVSADTEGASCEAGRVTSPRGFAAAYRQYVEGGWPRLGNAAEHGGHEAPYSLKLAVSEFMQAANQAWCMYALLNDGAIKTLSRFAAPEQIAAFVPKLVSGEWLSTMCLTEPQCGSDLSLVRCRAEATAHGTYRITGTKIFISSGEQDFTDNIVHLVLARLPDAPAGTRGISLFVVPKRRIERQGEAGALNAIRCLSIEHKMGLRASATCVMAFDGAEGWLVGEPNRGLSAMFVFINKSRLGTAQQAHAQAEASFQVAHAYAQERLAGRAPGGPLQPDTPADPLLAQPDIRRMLYTQQSIAAGGRALVLYCAQWADLADGGDEATRMRAERRLALLTPIAKGVVSEWGTEAADLGIQVLGGHGYMKEWAQEQRLRDVRITRIYEGTTAIQAMDLLDRKILGPYRADLQQLTQEILDSIDTGAASSMGDALRSAVALWRAVTERLEQSRHDPGLIPAIAVDYLMLAGYVLVGWMWLRSARVAQEKLAGSALDADFYRGKLRTARFYFEKLLPRISLHAALIDAGGDCLREAPSNPAAGGS